MCRNMVVLSYCHHATVIGDFVCPAWKEETRRIALAKKKAEEASHEQAEKVEKPSISPPDTESDESATPIPHTPAEFGSSSATLEGDNSLDPNEALNTFESSWKDYDNDDEYVGSQVEYAQTCFQLRASSVRAHAGTTVNGRTSSFGIPQSAPARCFAKGAASSRDKDPLATAPKCFGSPSASIAVPALAPEIAPPLAISPRCFERHEARWIYDCRVNTLCKACAVLQATQNIFAVADDEDRVAIARALEIQKALMARLCRQIPYKWDATGFLCVILPNGQLRLVQRFYFEAKDTTFRMQRTGCGSCFLPKDEPISATKPILANIRAFREGPVVTEPLSNQVKARLDPIMAHKFVSPMEWEADLWKNA